MNIRKPKAIHHKQWWDKASQTCFIPFNTAWTFSGLETAFWFWSSPFELPNNESGASGDETGVSSGEFASNQVELEIPWNRIIQVIKYKTSSEINW